MRSFRPICIPTGRRLALATLLPFVAVSALRAGIVEPYERTGTPPSLSRIDKLVLAALRRERIRPANLCSDPVFVRRAYLDIIGTLPKPAEVLAFMKNPRPRKRAALINQLMEREEFAEYWALKWSDLLRVKSEFPIKLWPNAVQAYHRWIRDAIRNNKPYDEFVRELLTSSGSNFRVPPVNFYRAIQGREPPAIAAAVALTFMGTRLAEWPEERRLAMETFFSRVAYKGTAEWKEEIVYLDPAATDSLEVVFPDGKADRVEAGEDPRRVFADWLLAPGNRWFARNIVNRVWSWLLGRGIIHPPDDLRADSRPANPKLLAYLERELIRADYDLRHIYRLILDSATYQLSSIPRSKDPAAVELFAYYPVRQLDAEVLIDALCGLFGGTEKYWSPIPEPFTFIPEQQRTIALADGSVTSPFLEMFGRPPRDTGLESERNNTPTEAQRLHLLNSSHIRQKIEKSWTIKRVLKKSKRDTERLVRLLYLSILSRAPTAAELGKAEEYVKNGGVNLYQATADLAWALINTKEFLFRH